MKAVVRKEYGPPEVLRLEELPDPVPRDDEIRVRVRAASVTLADCEMRTMRVSHTMWFVLKLYSGWRLPRHWILGQELAGEVDAVGDGVADFREGDRVFGPCDLSFGAHAEYKCLKASGPIAKIPEGVSFDDAATLCCGGINGLHFVRKTRVRSGESVLINGAGGSIGSYAIQLARLQGATVTAVDSGRKLEMLRSLGADHVVDYQQDDFTAPLGDPDGARYDVIIDIVGKIPYARSVRMLQPGGRLMLGNPTLSSALRGMWTSARSAVSVLSAPAGATVDDMTYLAELIQQKMIRAEIDVRYPLEGLVEAHRYVEDGLKLGNVIVNP